MKKCRNRKIFSYHKRYKHGMSYSLIKLNHFMIAQRNTYFCECKEVNTAESWLNQKANGDI
jgi:hypothetical protein